MSVPATDVLVFHCQDARSAQDLAKLLRIWGTGPWAGIELVPGPIFCNREVVVAEKFGKGFTGKLIPECVVFVDVARATEIYPVKCFFCPNGQKRHAAPTFKLERLFSRSDPPFNGGH